MRIIQYLRRSLHIVVMFPPIVVVEKENYFSGCAPYACIAGRHLPAIVVVDCHYAIFMKHFNGLLCPAAVAVVDHNDFVVVNCLTLY